MGNPSLIIKPSRNSSHLQMPRENSLKNGPPILFNNIPMARNNLLDIPPGHNLCTLAKAALILRSRIPVEPLLPLPRLRVQEAVYKFRIDPRICVYPCPRVLFVRRHVKNEVGVNQSAGRLVEEGDFLIRMTTISLATYSYNNTIREGREKHTHRNTPYQTPSQNPLAA